MSFKFNFQIDEDEKPAQESVEDEERNLEDLYIQPCEEIIPTRQDSKSPEIPLVSFEIYGDVCVQCLQSRAVEEKLCNLSNMQTGAVQAAESHSDLIPNVYEGGLTIWECAVDLSKYLCSTAIDFKNKTVLELGCGAGLPGVVALLAGATEVHFQDYNKEVVEHYTVPNVTMNCQENCKYKCRYFSGDWDSFRQRLRDENIRYDVILTAETIYRRESYSKLSQIFKDCLSPSGVIYLAAKSNYFGVGGGTQDFADFLEKQNIFKAELCHAVGKGLSREVWTITHK